MLQSHAPIQISKVESVGFHVVDRAGFQPSVSISPFDPGRCPGLG